MRKLRDSDESELEEHFLKCLELTTKKRLAWCGCASAILMAKGILKPKAINLGLFLKSEFMIYN